MPDRLHRAIRLPHATAMVVGTIIGASIFVQPSEVTGQVPSIGGVFLVWGIAGLLTLIGALVCAELASTFSETGGVYVYLREAYGPSLGFLWGWAMFWTMHSGIIAAVAVVCARYVAYFVPLGPNGVKAVAVAAIAILSAVNYRGVKHGSVLQATITAGKVFAIVVIIAFGFALGGRVPDHFVAASPTGPVPVANYALAVSAGLFAFGGWHMVTYNAEETVDARTTIPRALVLGTIVVTVCYMAMNAVYLYLLPLETVAASTRVAADAADVLFARGGGAAMSGLVVFSTFGALAGIVLAGPRVYYSMANDGVLFRWLGDVHPRYLTPHRAIILQGIWASVLVMTGTFRALFTRVIYTEWIFFALMTAGLFIFRRRVGLEPRYRMWGFPVTPIVFVVAALFIVAHQLAADPANSVTGLLLVASGLPVYYVWGRRPRS